MSSLAVEDDQIWLPTNVQVTVLRGRGLRGKGKHGTSDVYTIIQLGKEKYSTGVAEKTTEPEWREECCFELQPGALQGCSPAPSTELVFIVMHRALIGMDVFLGQAVVRLDKVLQETRGVKNQWFRLNSKTGKKEKERGEVQVSIQFTRNNLTASMYDLVMKDKSASTFSKLKEHMTGKRRSSDKDSSSAVLPSGYGSLYRMRQRLPSDGGGEEDYEDDEGGEARRSKMRTFFLRGKLRKSSDTRSSTSLGSESSESSSRGGSLSPTAGISVVVSDMSNSPSNSSNLTADNSPEHTANTSSLQCEFGDEASEISIAVPPPTVCVNGSHAHAAPPPDPPSGPPAASLGLGLLHKSLSLSTSLQNLSPRTSTAGDGRRWSFDKPGVEEKAAIAAALEKSGTMLSDEHQEEEEERRAALSEASTAESEIRDRKQRRNRFGQARSESAGKDQSSSGQAPPTTEEKHKGWFGSKDPHSKPSLVVSPKLEPLLPPSDPPTVDPLSGVPTLHHTNPFCPSQPTAPPISPCNPFFSLLQQNPFFDHMLTSLLPPLPPLSSSRPPIAQLFPQPSDPASAQSSPAASKHSVTSADSARTVIVTSRPLPPIPVETSSDSSAAAAELDSQWDESFQAFAAGRLQLPEDRPTDCITQQDPPRDPLLGLCTQTEVLPPAVAPRQNCNGNYSLRHQPFLASNRLISVTNHPGASLLVLPTILELKSFKRDRTDFTNPDSSETKPDFSSTGDLTHTNVLPCPCPTSSGQLGGNSTDLRSSGLGSSSGLSSSSGLCSTSGLSSSPGLGSSSGLGSSAEEDFQSCLSSQSNKLSASSSEEPESNILGFEKSSESAMEMRPSGTEDGLKDQPWDDVAHQTVIQHEDRNREKGSDKSTGDPGAEQTDETVNISNVLHPNMLLKPKLEFGGEIREQGVDAMKASVGDFMKDSTDVISEEEVILSPSLHLATSSVRQLLVDVSCEVASDKESEAKFTSFSDLLEFGHAAGRPVLEDGHTWPSNKSSSSFVQSLPVSGDSQDDQTCRSWPWCSTSEVSSQDEDGGGKRCGCCSAGSNQPDGSKLCCSGQDETPERSSTISSLAADLNDSRMSRSRKELSEGGMETRHALSNYRQSHEALLHRSRSEGSLAPDFEGLLQPSFGSDPGAIQESPLALPRPDPPSVLPSAPPLTSPVALATPPLLASASARFPPGALPVSVSMPQVAGRWQQAAEQQNSPHPVKPLPTAMLMEERRSVLATGLEKLKSTISPGRSSLPSKQDADRKKPLTEGAGSYYHLTHNELVSLLVQREEDLNRQKLRFEQQKLLLAKRELELRRLKPQVRDLEDYIDTLLVRIMEQKPTLLQVRSKLK